MALLVAMTLSLLVMAAWLYVPLNDLRRFQIACVLGGDVEQRYDFLYLIALKV